jgi:hypothetical protein
MAITDKTKLIGLLKLETSNLDDYLDDIIDQLEPDLLDAWFGYAMRKDLLSDTPSTEAQALIDGFEYTDDDGYLQKIVGLSDSLVYFVYYWVVRDKQTTDSNIGGLSELAENAQRANPVQKAVNNYNRGVYHVNNMIEYVNDNDDTYTDFEWKSYIFEINQYGI